MAEADHMGCLAADVVDEAITAQWQKKLNACVRA